MPCSCNAGRMRSGAVSASVPAISAPIKRSGAITRRIGRRDSEASPINVLAKPWPTKMPAIRRMPVPALPQSSGAVGACNCRRPTPVIRSSVRLSVRTCAPIACIIFAVWTVSSPGKKPLIRLSPVARAPNSAARWLMDLSPSTNSVPRILVAGSAIKSICCFTLPI
jgi:hypothetical protein